MAKKNENKVEDQNIPEEVFEIFKNHQFANVVYFQDGNYYLSLDDKQILKAHLVYYKDENNKK